MLSWKGGPNPADARRMPGQQPKVDRKPAQPQKPRQLRPHGFARARMTPTQRVEYVLEQCPDCGTPLSGGWTQRTREVIDLPQVPAQVTEHTYIAAPAPSADGAACPQRNRTAWRWVSSGWG